MTELTLKQIQDIQFDILCTIVSLCEKHNLRYYLFGGTLLGAVRHGNFIPWDDDIDIAMPRGDLDMLENICKKELPANYTFVNWRDDWRIGHNIAKVCDTNTVWIEETRDDYKVEIGVYIDIFPLDGVPKGIICKIIHGYMLRLACSLLTLNTIKNHRDRSFYKRTLISLIQAWGNESRIKRLHMIIDRLSRKYAEEMSTEWASYLDFRGIRDYMPKTYVEEGTIVKFRDQSLAAFKEYDKYLSITYGDYMTMPPPDKRKSHHKYTAYYRTQP